MLNQLINFLKNLVTSTKKIDAESRFKENPKTHLIVLLRDRINTISEHEKIHPGILDAVKKRTSIIDTVSDHIDLTLAGKDLIGLCPFCKEKDKNKPSFAVSPKHQIFFCFTCMSCGDSLDFLAKIQGRSFSDVVLELANKHNIQIKEIERSL